MTGFIQQIRESVSTRAERDFPAIAGTSAGLLWFTKSERRMELEGRNVTAIAPTQDGLWAIAAICTYGLLLSPLKNNLFGRGITLEGFLG